jgi:hypothetical protein
VAAPSAIRSREGGGAAKAWCGGTRGSGRSFYRRSGRGKGGEVASTDELATTVMMAHRGDGTTRAGEGEGTARAQCAGAHDAKPS